MQWQNKVPGGRKTVSRSAGRRVVALVPHGCGSQIVRKGVDDSVGNVDRIRMEAIPVQSIDDHGVGIDPRCCEKRFKKLGNKSVRGK